MSKLFHSLGLVSLLALCIASPFQAHAQSTQATPQDNTFSGAVAPAQRPSETGQPPAGYRGVMPGHVAPLPEQQQTPVQPVDENGNPVKRMQRKPPPKPVEKTDRADQADQADQGDEAAQPQPRKHAVSTPDRGMSVRPGFEKHKPLTAEDLKQIAAMTGIEVRLDQIPDNMANAIHMPAHVYPLVSLPQPRIDGMLPLEFSAKQMIDKEMEDVNNASKISPEAHQKAVNDAIVTLSNFAHSARVKRDMPAEIYQTMGVPNSFIKESKEGSGKAADRLEAAIKDLQDQL